MRYCVLKNKKMPWGDYGSILLSGMACHSKEINGRYQIERTGPFCPPITDSGIWRFVINAQMKKIIEENHSDVAFIKCIKRKVSYVDWTKWDLSAQEPKFYPKGGDPEDYILSKPHSLFASLKLGPLFQFNGPVLNYVPGSKTGEVDGLDRDNGKVVRILDTVGHRTVFREDFAKWLVDNSDGWTEINNQYEWPIK